MLDASEDSVDGFDAAASSKDMRRALVAEQGQRRRQPVRGLVFVSEYRYRMRHDGHEATDVSGGTFRSGCPGCRCSNPCVSADRRPTQLDVYKRQVQGRDRKGD